MHLGHMLTFPCLKWVINSNSNDIIPLLISISSNCNFYEFKISIKVNHKSFLGVRSPIIDQTIKHSQTIETCLEVHLCVGKILGTTQYQFNKDYHVLVIH